MSVSFGPLGPFDEREQELVQRAATYLEGAGRENAVDDLRVAVARLERLTEAVAAFRPQTHPESLPATRRVEFEGDPVGPLPLLQQLAGASLATFEACLPTRALLVRDLVMAEVNFYRFVRAALRASAQRGADRAPAATALLEDVEDCLCRSLHARLVLHVLTNIASDARVDGWIRLEAAKSLWQLWSDVRYRMSDAFPALAATWDARRRVRVVLGTLVGTVEMYELIGEGCDPRFVEWLLDPSRPAEQAEAFREFLFGASTEDLARLEERMRREGRTSIRIEDLPPDERPRDAYSTDGDDPSTTLFEFFLTRHLWASARRRMGLPGPSRTAEEYVLLHFLEERGETEL